MRLGTGAVRPLQLLQREASVSAGAGVPFLAGGRITQYGCSFVLAGAAVSAWVALPSTAA